MPPNPFFKKLSATRRNGPDVLPEPVAPKQTVPSHESAIVQLCPSIFNRTLSNIDCLLLVCNDDIVSRKVPLSGVYLGISNSL